MSNIQLEESNAGEIMHLFEVMKKYNAKCSLELNLDNHSQPFIGIAQANVTTEYIQGENEGDTVVIHLDGCEFSFDLASHSFAKKVTDCQILIAIMSDNYAAWFDSTGLPQEGIDLAKNYDDTCGEFEDKVIELNVLSPNFYEELDYMKQLIEEGRVVKNVKVLGGGEQVLTVGYIDGEQS
ncbi:hypothetical protein J27TS7_34100 [Paenibacillus dendritiformis]|uniref:hypothetical protein n=1 Tax=Paenibacillus dendritiformis TaxID=130049 RepID=UPI001B2C8BD2|nr:hypothetical protein [Paenibacillus dendritiformis]GIO73896.1 hypothetical protein J27TS7_34100 [Paenibacillus dendritiformis]